MTGTKDTTVVAATRVIRLAEVITAERGRDGVVIFLGCSMAVAGKFAASVMGACVY